MFLFFFCPFVFLLLQNNKDSKKGKKCSSSSSFIAIYVFKSSKERIIFHDFVGKENSVKQRKGGEINLNEIK